MTTGSHHDGVKHLTLDLVKLDLEERVVAKQNQQKLQHDRQAE